MNNIFNTNFKLYNKQFLYYLLILLCLLKLYIMSQDSYKNYSGTQSNLDNQMSFSYTDFDKSFNSSSFENSTGFSQQSCSSSSNQNSYQNENMNSQTNSYQQKLYPREQVRTQKNIEQSQIPKVSKTVRDLLDIPVQRQQYLKQLSNQQLQRQNQYILMFSRPDVLLSLFDYYQKIIPNEQFNKKVKQIKSGRQIKQILYFTSVIGYVFVYLTGKLTPPTSNYKGIFKKNSHFLIPAFLTSLILFDQAKTRNKTNIFLQDRTYLPFFHIAVRRFLCSANKLQKQIVLSQA